MGFLGEKQGFSRIFFTRERYPALWPSKLTKNFKERKKIIFATVKNVVDRVGSADLEGYRAGY